jgi:hypothetical protein
MICVRAKRRMCGGFGMESTAKGGGRGGRRALCAQRTLLGVRQQVGGEGVVFLMRLPAPGCGSGCRGEEERGTNPAGATERRCERGGG